jgi:hypothetical protein
MWKIRSDDKAREEYAIKQVLPPCQIKCPIGEPIQRTNVMISLLTPSLEKAKDEIIQIEVIFTKRILSFLYVATYVGCAKENVI